MRGESDGKKVEEEGKRAGKDKGTRKRKGIKRQEEGRKGGDGKGIEKMGR